ncbi:hypothetical protein OYC64_015081 [Pagothenia borchgrevinki]|uniref:Uncharacterized protein n=1 Tax=Pagothenia borchgrevinki TaxID=8213 RepID=A0ABD2H2P9_PAGBO
MKTFCVAVAVVLTCICIQESSAVPSYSLKRQEMEEPRNNDSPGTEELPEEPERPVWGDLLLRSDDMRDVGIDPNPGPIKV